MFACACCVTCACIPCTLTCRYPMTEWVFSLHSNITEWNQNVTFLTTTVGKTWAWNVCVWGRGHCVPDVYLKKVGSYGDPQLNKNLTGRSRIKQNHFSSRITILLYSIRKSAILIFNLQQLYRMTDRWRGPQCSETMTAHGQILLESVMLGITWQLPYFLFQRLTFPSFSFNLTPWGFNLRLVW